MVEIHDKNTSKVVYDIDYALYDLLRFLYGKQYPGSKPEKRDYIRCAKIEMRCSTSADVE